MIELIIALCLALGTPAPGSNGGVTTQDTGGQTGQTPPPPPPPPHG
ncbi:hypothetical protein [Mucilaginibacter achroorhodeus]|nr:hypothetical protein [Mucilaginibacter achroorhodeus]